MNQSTGKQNYRNNTSIKAVFDQLCEIPVGGIAEVRSFNLFSGNLNSHAKTRMFIAKVSVDTGVKVTTRVVDGALLVRRIK